MRLKWRRQDLELFRPFTISRGTETRKQTIVVELNHSRVTGLGEAVPTDYYGQSLESAEQTFEEAADLLGDDPFRLQTILDGLLMRFDGQRAAVAAIDAALHDWIGRKLHLPVWKLLGLDPTKAPPTSFTIGIDDPDTVEQKVLEAQHHPVLKIKLGTPHDEQILQAVRRAAPDKPLRVDANAGWKPEEALDRLHMVASYNVDYIEQPVPPDDLDTLCRLRQASVLPIVVDESAERPEDLGRLSECVDGVNIKLEKCGGIRAALQMIHTARSLGMKVMLGCMVSSSLNIAAAAQLSPLVDWLDLDGHLLLARDPFEGLGYDQGRLVLSDAPGLGVRPVAQNPEEL